MMYAFTFLPSKLCLKCVKLFKNKVFVFFFAERLLFKLCKRNNFKRRGGGVRDYIKNTYLIRMLTYSKSPKQQVFSPQNAPLCNCAFFLSCEYTAALWLPSWLPSKAVSASSIATHLVCGPGMHHTALILITHDQRWVLQQFDYVFELD